MSNPETPDFPEFDSGNTLAARFKELLDRKFSEGVATPSRKYEERLVLLVTKPLPECPHVRLLTAERPIPGQEQEAQTHWQHWGGHRVSFTEYTDERLDETGHTPSSATQTAFFTVGDEMYMRRLRASMGKCDMTPMETLPSDKAEEVLTWIDSALTAPSDMY